MLDIFSALRLVLKPSDVTIDNTIVRWHWYHTFIMLVSFSIMVTARQYVGQPIECSSSNKIPEALLNSYCWVQSTFTIPQACNGQIVGTEVPYPCIDNTRGREVKYFNYYQWVGVMLFIQGILFRLPYILWSSWESGLIEAITSNLRVPLLDDDERERKKYIVVDYIHEHLGCHKSYAYKYFTCEWMSLINLLSQLWWVDRLFDGQFLSYGIDVIKYYSNNSIQTVHGHNSSLSSHPNQQQQQQSLDPMSFVFPRMTKCTYFDFGSSGDVQKHDALCLLPLNIINEKLYLAMWFWFLLLAILTVLVIVWRILTFLFESKRCWSLMSRCKLSNEDDIRLICKHCDVGDYFLFLMVAENLDPIIMREILHSIAIRIEQHFELKRKLHSLETGSNLDASELADAAKAKEALLSQLSGGDLETTVSGASGRRPSAGDRDRRPSIRRPLTRQWSLDSPAPSAHASRRNSTQPVLVHEDPSGPASGDSSRLLMRRLWSRRMWRRDSNAEDDRNYERQPATNPELMELGQVSSSSNGCEQVLSGVATSKYARHSRVYSVGSSSLLKLDDLDTRREASQGSSQDSAYSLSPPATGSNSNTHGLFQRNSPRSSAGHIHPRDSNC